MANSRRFVIRFFIFLLTASGLAALESGPQLTAVWMRGQQAAVEVFLQAGDAAPLLLAVGVTGREKPTAVPEVAGGSQLKVLARPVGQAAAPIQVGTVAIPAVTAHSYLLLLAAANGGASISGMALPDDLRNFPANSVRVANFSQQNYLLKYGAQVSPLTAGVSSHMPYALSANMGTSEVKSFPFAVADQKRILLSTNLQAWPNSRTLVLITAPTERGEAPGAQFIVDSPMAESQVPATR
jgi:hypothetical protein